MRSRGLAGEAGLIVVRRSVVVARALCTPTPCLDPSRRCSGKTGFRASLLPGRLLPPLLCTAVTAGGSCFPGARTLFGWPDSEGKHHLHEHYSFLGYTVHVTVNSVYSQTPADREAGNGRTAGGRHGHALAVIQPPDDGRAGQRAQFEEALVRPLRGERRGPRRVRPGGRGPVVMAVSCLACGKTRMPARVLPSRGRRLALHDRVPYCLRRAWSARSVIAGPASATSRRRHAPTPTSVSPAGLPPPGLRGSRRAACTARPSSGPPVPRRRG